jgi:Flp pilus assembly protein TadG
MVQGMRKRPNARGKRGTAILEYALVVPVLLLFVLGIIDMGRLMWTYTFLARAVEEGARCGAINTSVCGTTGQIQSAAAAAVWGMTVPPSAFSVYQENGVRVKANYPFNFITPGLGTIKLKPSACYVSLTASYGDDGCEDD